MNKLTVLMITKDPDPIIERSINSVKRLAGEIVIIDDFSKKGSLDLILRYNPKVFFHKESNLGKQKAWGLKKCKSEWVLSLDSDEIVSPELATEIKNAIKQAHSDISGFIIPFQNHFLNRAINHGGEDYRMLRLFRKKDGYIKSSLVHERFELKSGKIKYLKNKILHYSYRSISQVYTKFTDYAKREAVIKFKNNEKSSLKKIILYPVHMFYARFIKDKGYKDGLFRIPLDLGFAYMEFLTYLLLAFKKKKK